ncbi:DMT family transporter, partial [Patescibacteria group bacterium]|nr:DMT family transporter [Patescibacteria group bacterium]
SLELPIGIYLGMLILKEKITIEYLKIAGVILIGFLLLIVKSGIKISLASNFIIGVLLALGAALLWGVSTVLGKLFLNKEISPVIVTCIRGLTGAGFSLGLSLLVLPSVIIPFFDLEKFDWLKIGYLGVGVSAFGLLFYYQALKRLEIKKISLVYILQPVVATGLGVATGEVMLLSQWMGGVLVIIGIINLLKFKE